MKLEKEGRINSIEINREANEIVVSLGVKNIDDRFYHKICELYNSSLGYNVKLTLEIKEPILDEAEREYLSGVIRPFRNRIKYIKKKGCDNIEYIAIIIKNDDNLMFPNFKKGSMYKNLELNKEYTLDDLDL